MLFFVVNSVAPSLPTPPRARSEALVGVALAQAYSELQLGRSQFWLQTKYSHGQWKQSALGFAEQVQRSVAESLEHLQTTYLDSLLLHGPLNKRSQTLPVEDWEAWREMEKLHDGKVVKSLGISNVNPSQLRELLAKARIKPDVVYGNFDIIIDHFSRLSRFYATPQCRQQTPNDKLYCYACATLGADSCLRSEFECFAGITSSGRSGRTRPQRSRRWASGAKTSGLSAGSTGSSSRRTRY